MSMTVEQRRTEVIDVQEFPAGLVRLAKASSRYDRRRRYWVVEILRAQDRTLGEYAWRPVRDFGVSEPDAEHRAFEAYAAVFMTVRAMS